VKWNADPNDLDKLGDYQDVDQFEIRVPKGWNAVDAKNSVGGDVYKAFQWRSADGGTLGVRFAMKPAHQFDPVPPAVIWVVTAEICPDATDAQTTPVEMGLNNDLKLARTRFRYTRPTDGVKVHGIACIHWEGPVLCELIFLAGGPGSDKDQVESLCTASILSFRKKK
jgi:hypothetical protein